MNETNTTPTTPAFSTLLDTILNAINTHINLQVEAKINNVMQSHATMKQIDDGFDSRIQVMVNEAVADHENIENHFTRDDIAEEIGDRVQQEVTQQIRNHDFSNEVYDAITDYDFDDKIDSYDFDSKMDEWKDVNDILDKDQVREMVEEILEEKLKEMLGKLSITIKEE
jgi:hypothetical protein